MSNGQIHFDLEGIAHLLADRDLTVPAYQRSYAWGEEEIEEYWSDLSGALEAGATYYFLGTVVLTGQGLGAATIIDGQQRLATTTLLLAALRDSYAVRDDSRRAQIIQDGFLTRADLGSSREIERLTLNAEDRHFFGSIVVDGLALEASTTSEARIKAAYEFFRSRVEADLGQQGDDWSDRIRQWVDFLDKRVRTMVVEVPELADAFVIFETLNDRGADLTTSDLLRNYLLSEAGDRAEEVQSAWIELLSNLGLQEDTGTAVDFLRHYWSSRSGAVRERDLYDAITDAVSGSAAVATFAAELPEPARFYAALLDDTDDLWQEFPDDARGSVAALGRLELAQYRPLALAVLQRFDPQEAARALRGLVSWALRGLVVGGIGGGVAERAYASAAQRVRDGSVTTAEDVLRQLLPIVPTDDDFKAAFARARLSRPAVGRYVLLSLERRKRDIQSPELIEPAFEEGMRLQHVMPRDGRLEDWPTFDDDDRLKQSASRIGNFVLLAPGEPNLIGARTFRERSDVFEKSSVRLTREVASNKDWTPSVLATRQQGLADLAVEVWPRNPH